MNNIKTDAAELCALGRLLEAHRDGKIAMYRSLVDLREIMKTKDIGQRQVLLRDYEQLCPIPMDERVCGFAPQCDQYGGSTGSPLVSDVQDEKICAKLEERGLEPVDAQHITQAICNRCDVFLTRDGETIIRQHRAWIEEHFQPLKVYRPSEVLSHISI